MSDMEQFHREVLDDGDNRNLVIDILAEFFQDSFKDDPVGVADWLAQGRTTPDLFVGMVAQLRSSITQG